MYLRNIYVVWLFVISSELWWLPICVCVISIFTLLPYCMGWFSSIGWTSETLRGFKSSSTAFCKELPKSHSCRSDVLSPWLESGMCLFCWNVEFCDFNAHLWVFQRDCFWTQKFEVNRALSMQNRMICDRSFRLDESHACLDLLITSWVDCLSHFAQSDRKRSV